VPFASEPEFLVLHGLRVRGYAEPEVLADAIGLGVDEVTKHLDVFDTDGLVVHRAGAISGWTLTSAGREEDEVRAAAELDAAGTRAVVERSYQAYHGMNGDLLQLCTDWQLRPTDGGTVANDHDDATYDAGVIARLVEIDDAIQPVCARLAEALERFGGYGERLTRAVVRVKAGEKDWFTKPVIDSYHTVWFELHENLLATLGIERGKETS
jgi:hypothetical protein